MDTVVTPVKEFSKNSIRLVKRCTKPDRKGTPLGRVLHNKLAGKFRMLQTPVRRKAKGLMLIHFAEFNKICSRTALGFVVMGFIGFFVKLIFIVSPSANDQLVVKLQHHTSHITLSFCPNLPVTWRLMIPTSQA